MNRIIRLLLALTLGLISTTPASAQDAAPVSDPAAAATSQPASAVSLDPDELELARLIDQMGSTRYADRQAAFQKLDELGPTVVPLLKPYLNHPSPEVRMRLAAL
ncbi:MAG TPA: hypothetical protein VM243_15980, partial [Phycisphaerae bacterium]|nr:hypothetical protein [Phycisphaerae bacterium]